MGWPWCSSRSKGNIIIGRPIVTVIVTTDLTVTSRRYSNNPTSKEYVKVYFSNIAEGKYLLRLFNNVGQIMHTKEIVHAGGNAIQYLEPELRIPTGLYHLEIKNIVTGKKSTHSIIFVQ